MTRIFAHLAPCPLGDFIAHALLASSIKELFHDSELFIYYREDRPYKRAVVDCIRNATAILAAPADHPGLPIDYFNSNHGRPVFNSSILEENHVYRSNLILSGACMDDAMLNSIPLTTLKPSEEMIEGGARKLKALGLVDGQWLATIYWKESGYQFRNEHPQRTIYDPGPYLAAIQRIQELGGQVIRLGHPSPTRVPGVIDLAQVEGSEALQAYAVSVSRFLLASGSGPASYGPAFNVPTAVVDQTLCYGVWRPHDYVVTQGVVYGGECRSGENAWEAGWLRTEWAPKARVGYVRNAAEQLRAVVDEMFEATREPPAPVVKRAPVDYLMMPIPRAYRPSALIPPSQRPTAVANA